MSAVGLLELGITPRQAMFLEYVAGFQECFASMTHLASKIGVSQRHGFRIQAALREKGLLGSSVARDRNATPSGAKKPAQLKHNGWSVRSLAGTASVWFEQKRLKIEQWRQSRDEKRRAHREDMRARREAQQARKSTENAPPSPPHYRPFPPTEPSEPVARVTAPPAELLARFRRPPD